MTQSEVAGAASYLRAVHRLTDVASRAAGAEAICEEALDVLIGTLGADRAAVLLLDDRGVMRFTAWRDLSDEYRQVAQGHSPWPADATDPEPVLVPDVSADPTLAGLRDTILREGIRALAFFPLVSGGRLLGKFMAYFAAEHAFTPEEVELAQTLAGHVAFAIDRRRLESELRVANAALAATLDAVPDGITVQGPDGGLIFANDDAAAMLGYASPGDLLAAGPATILQRFEVFDEDGRPLPLSELPGRRALQGENPPEMLIRYRIAGGADDKWSLVSARPVLSDTGAVRFAVNVFRDVTERQRAVEALSQVASTLQRALLPPELPDIPGLELAARYHAAASDIGGDFYDVIRVGPSRWLISVGDVCGKGIEAASFTAMVRYTLRAFAASATSPSELLAQVNDALLRQLGPERFCTLACGIFDTAGDETRLAIALGGHPRPLLVSPSGHVRPVGIPGSLLGTLPEPDLVDEDVVLGPGDALVMFTDGCVSGRAGDEERLVTALRHTAGCDAKAIAEAVEAAGHADVEHVDDLTVLACRRVCPALA